MTAAYRLKGIGWFGSCVAVVLGFYLVSLQVAAERKKLDDVNAKIQAAQRDIRALETEFDTRANLAQLEKWNGDTLALSAPTAAQFVPNEAALAAMDATRADGAVQSLALVVPSLPDAVPADASAPVAVAAVEAAPAGVPVKAVAAVRTPTPVAAVKTKPEAVAMLDRKLLSDRTLGDILNGARSEGGRVR